LKKLPNKLQSYNEAFRIVEEIFESNKGKGIRVPGHLLSYAYYQFGQQVPGRDYRVRTDGQRIANWDDDIRILLNISTRMTATNATNLSNNPIIRNNKMFPHLERSLNNLRPWMDIMDSNAINQSSTLNFGQINTLLSISFYTERSMALVAIDRNEFDFAEGLCHRCLANARKLGVEGEKKITLIYEALEVYFTLRQRQGDFQGALTFAEEAYNVVVDAYDPLHPQSPSARSYWDTDIVSDS
jgi:hypothetical protein